MNKHPQAGGYRPKRYSLLSSRFCLVCASCFLLVIIFFVPKLFSSDVPQSLSHIASPAPPFDSPFTAKVRNAKASIEPCNRGNSTATDASGSHGPNTDPSRCSRNESAHGHTVDVTNSSAVLASFHVDDRSLFVSIASFRDLECAPTIEDMFLRASRPELLFVGAVEQHDREKDPSCFPPSFRDVICTDDHQGRHPERRKLNFCPSRQIRQLHVRHTEAKGPTFGRYMAMKMYRGESYFMMIDSHNRFTSGWDNIAVEMLDSLPKKSVLTHYPEAWNNPSDGKTNAPLDNRRSVSYMCKAVYISHLGYPRFDGIGIYRSKRPRPQPWAAAGFLFAHGRMVQEIPFDPHLNYIFDGEEILYSIRMWTHGYDMYSPSQNILYHYYYRQKSIKFWSILPTGYQIYQSLAVRRVQLLIGAYKHNTSEYIVDPNTQDRRVIQELDVYGLGNERTLDQWYEFAGIDRVTRTSSKNFCKLYNHH